MASDSGESTEKEDLTYRTWETRWLRKRTLSQNGAKSSQGSVATRLSVGSLIIIMMHIYSRVSLWKNFKSRSTFGEVSRRGFSSHICV